MTDRPTPEQIADRSAPADVHSRREFLDVLAHHGYVIVHPDDFAAWLRAEGFEPLDPRMWDHLFGKEQP